MNKISAACIFAEQHKQGAKSPSCQQNQVVERPESGALRGSAPDSRSHALEVQDSAGLLVVRWDRCYGAAAIPIAGTCTSARDVLWTALDSAVEVSAGGFQSGHFAALLVAEPHLGCFRRLAARVSVQWAARLPMTL